MDYQDHFHPNNVDNELIKNIKKIDTGYAKVNRFIPTQSGYLKKKGIEVYVSGIIGNRIRDAKTGHYYQDKIGTNDELNFFKVSCATGELNTRNGLNSLFYLSPSDYEMHMNHKLDDIVHQKWQERQLK
jgi:hypothetical protein